MPGLSIGVPRCNRVNALMPLLVHSSSSSTAGSSASFDVTARTRSCYCVRRRLLPQLDLMPLIMPALSSCQHTAHHAIMPTAIRDGYFGLKSFASMYRDMKARVQLRSNFMLGSIVITGHFFKIFYETA